MNALRDMHLFVEVASAGGFRAAAERLGMPNSTLSRRVAELEREIGLRLFNRTTRKVDLTEAGRLYFERCRRLIDEARLAHEELSGMVTQPTGLIRASVPVDFAVVYLSGILADFLRLYPGLRLDLDVTPRQSNLISEPVDLTIRIGEPKEQQLIARRLGASNVALFASPEYLATHGTPTKPGDLERCNCLRTSNRPWTLRNIHNGDQTVVEVSGTVTANNPGLLRRLALQGVGVVALAEALADDDIRTGRLVEVLPEWRPPDVPVYVLTETRLVPAKVRVFIDFLVQNLKSPSGSLFVRRGQ